MEWREQSVVGCELAFSESQRWIEEVTKKKFGGSNFRSALEDGVLLCDLINQLQPGIIKRVNRLSTPIAGLDNVNVFLKACGKLGLNDAQLFHPGDLQDVSTRVTVRRQETSRRLKNVLITIYWLGRKAHADPSYSGPQLNFKAFEGLLGIALSKALEEASCSKSSVRDSGFAETWYPDREVLGYRREDSVESLGSVESHTLSAASDCTLKAGSEGFGSDAEAEHCFRMSEPLTGTSKDGRNIPSALRRKRFEQQGEVSRGWVGPLHSENGQGLVSPCLDLPPVSAFHQWAHDYQSDSVSDSDEPQPDPVQDDLASRRFRSTTSTAPVNFTVPLNPGCSKPFPAVTPSARRSWVTMSDSSRMAALPREILSLRLPEGGAPCAGSKSMSDLNLEPGAQEAESIPALYLLTLRSKAATVSLRQERTWQNRGRLKESEVKWQEDLSRWKTRRWSVTSDLHKKKDSKQLELISGGNIQVGEQQERRRNLQKEEPDVSCISTAEAPSSSLLTSRGSSMSGPVISTGPALAQGVDSGTASAADSAPVPLQRAKSLEGVYSGTSQMSAVLPRGFRRSEGTSRLSTGVTPRPFSSNTTRMSAQARFYSLDETNSNPQDIHQLPASVPQHAAPGCKHDACSNKHAVVLREEEVKEKRNDSAPSIHSFMSASVLVSKAVSASSGDEVDHCDMQVTLNQTPGSGTDFGFLAHWDSTSARIKSVAPGSPAQLCHLQAGDEIVALAGQRVAEMSYEQWKANMDATLREGKLLMDIRRICLNGHSGDHTSVSSTCSLPRKNDSKAQINGHPVNSFPFKATKPSSCDNSVPTKLKGSSASSVDSSVYLCGGSESGILDLQVPSISASSSRWSWNTEEDRRRQEQWQIEQEHLLQEKYRRDQERLEEAWRRAQHDAALEENRVPDVSQPLEQSKSPTSVSPTRHINSKQVQIAAHHPPKDWYDSSSKTSQWQSESYGFTTLTTSDRKKSKSTPTLDGSHKQNPRASINKKSQLSQMGQERLQILEEMRKKTQVLTDSSWIRQRSTCTIHKEPIDMAPLRRHESLDNIRSSSRDVSSISSSKQFTGSSHILPGLGSIVPYRGYSGRRSLGAGAAIFSRALRQSSWSRPGFISPVSDTEVACNRAEQQDRLVGRRHLCSRCEQPLVKGPAMVIESLDLCFHVGCFKCVSCRTELRTDSDSGAQVRVRHRQLFCDTCYNRLQVRTGIPK